jgi:hypothetical protein
MMSTTHIPLQRHHELHSGPVMINCFRMPDVTKDAENSILEVAASIATGEIDGVVLR